jgi:hypothetical protein
VQRPHSASASPASDDANWRTSLDFPAPASPDTTTSPARASHAARNRSNSTERPTNANRCWTPGNLPASRAAAGWRRAPGATPFAAAPSDSSPAGDGFDSSARVAAATNCARDSSSSSSASKSNATVDARGAHRRPPSNALIPAALIRARSARASCVSTAASRCLRRSTPKLSGAVTSTTERTSKRRGQCNVLGRTETVLNVHFYGERRGDVRVLSLVTARC